MKFGTIIADPPWEYGKPTKSRAEMRTEKSSGRWRRDSDGKDYYFSGHSGDEYESISTKDLCELPVRELSRDDSVLLLWATMPLLPDALKVVDAWGFTYVTAVNWVKIRGVVPPTPMYGVGFWFRGATELVLVGKRKRAWRSNYIGFMSNSFEHSRKPDDLHKLSEECYPGPYLELFGRRSRDNWTVVGDEAPGYKGEHIEISLKKLLESQE